MPARLGHHQARAGLQRPKELPHRHVEAERRLLQHHVAGSEPEPVLHPQQLIGDPRGGRWRHPWAARRPRRVDHIRQTVGPASDSTRPAEPRSVIVQQRLEVHRPSRPGVDAIVTNRALAEDDGHPGLARPCTRAARRGTRDPAARTPPPAMITPWSAATSSTDRSHSTPDHGPGSHARRRRSRRATRVASSPSSRIGDLVAIRARPPRASGCRRHRSREQRHQRRRLVGRSLPVAFHLLQQRQLAQRNQRRSAYRCRRRRPHRSASSVVASVEPAVDGRRVEEVEVVGALDGERRRRAGRR